MVDPGQSGVMRLDCLGIMISLCRGDIAIGEETGGAE